MLSPAELYLPPDALRERINALPRAEICGKDHPRAADALPLGDAPAPAVPLTQKGDTPAAALKSFLANYPGRVLMAADSAGRREALIAPTA